MHEQFGRYILLERIAIGGMAEIFRAKAPGLGGFEKVLAIKRLHPRYSQDADFIEMLIDEARITVELAHGNIGQIFDLGKVDDHYFIAMEYIDGRDLYRVMKRLRERHQQFPLDAAAHVAMEACAGLDYAHRKKDARGRPLHIIHRDVSPQNVLLSYEGEVKLVDFGIAKAALRAYETESGIIKGKFYYMSPEQARGEHLDHRTDVFSLGIVLYEMLTGDLLYKDDDEVTLLSRVRRAEIEPPSALRPEIPQALERIVMRALARDREERYPSALHFQRDLARYLRDAGSMFNKSRLGQLTRELFLDEPPPTAELGADLLRDRSDFGVDRLSVISVARFAEGEDRTAVDPQSLDGSAGQLDSAMGSDIMEVSASDIELLDDSENATLEGPSPAPDAFDSIESADLFDGDPFESEDTRTFEPERPARVVRVRPGSETPRALRAPDPVPFAERPTPVPAPAPAVRPAVAPRAPLPVPRPQPVPEPEPAPLNRRPTVIVPVDGSKEAQAAGARPARANLRGDTPPVRRPVSGGETPFVTRERVVMGGILVAVIVLAAVVTSLLTNDGPSTAAAESAPVGVTVGTPVAPPTPAADTATLRITSYPSGADVKVDGKWLAHESTPTSYEVPAGRPVQVRVALAGYEPYDTEVTLERGRSQEVHARLERQRGTLTVESKPSGATVFVDNKEVGRTPTTVADVDVNKPVRVRVTKDGFVAHETTVDLSGEGREKTVNVDLEPVAVDPPVVAAVEDPPAPKARPRPPPARRAAVERPARRSPPPQRAPRVAAANDRDAASGVGYISVTARRWGAVYLNGNQVALETPLIKYRVPAGTHQVYVAFGGDRNNRSDVRRINVARGRTTLVKF